MKQIAKVDKYNSNIITDYYYRYYSKNKNNKNKNKNEFITITETMMEIIHY